MPDVSVLQVEPLQERIVPLSPTVLQKLVDGHATLRRPLLLVVPLASVLQLEPFQERIVPSLVAATALHRLVDGQTTP